MANPMSKASPSTSAVAPLIGALVLADVTSAFETTMVFTAVKALLQTYGQPVTVGWLLTAYLLMSAAAGAICGRLGDLFGRRAVLLLMLVLCGAGSMVSALSPSLAGVIVGRFLQGFSGAILPLCVGLARERISAKHLPASIGAISASQAAGGGLGMLLGGILIDHFGWRSIFWASSGFVIVSLLAVLLFVAPTKPSEERRSLDLAGGLLFVPAIAAILLAVSNAKAWSLDPRFWELLLGGGALLAIWVVHELRHPHPLIEVRLLANRNVALPNAAMALCAFGAFQFSQIVLLLMQQPAWTGVGLGVSATVAGLLKLPGNFLTTLGSPAAGWACGRWGGAVVIAVGMTATGLSCVAVLVSPATWR